MNNALWSRGGAQAGERTHTAGDTTLTCECLREFSFSKKFETVLMGYSGAGGN
jgi:hypothetical protein